MTTHRDRRLDLSHAHRRCAHCGLGVPTGLVREGEELQFCCSGCRHVHGFLMEFGYGEYYRLADSSRVAGAPARVSGRGFEDFDDPMFWEQNVGATVIGHQRVQLYLDGVHCAACVWLVEKLPELVPGLQSVRLNMATSVAEVIWDGEATQLSVIGRALDNLGYTPHRYRSDLAREARRAEDRALLIKVGVAAAAAMNIMFLQVALYAGSHTGMSPPYESFFRWLAFGLSLPVILFSARPFFRAALGGLRSRVPHIDLPVSLALLVAFGYSAASTVSGSGPVYFDSLAALVALLLGARFIQSSAQRKAMERAESLRSVAFAEFARRIDGGDLESSSLEVPVAALRPGDRVEVRSGELIPVDGTILAGCSTLDNAILTGESEPVKVKIGDNVHAGATNLGARVVVKVEATGTATRVGALLALVQEAMSLRPPLVEVADRLSRWFVVAVIGLAAVAGAAWMTVSVGVALEHVVALLVITCPCALGLATPVAMTVGLSRAARSGFFIKHPAAFEELRRVDTVFLDKTGTLTQGRATVSRWAGTRDARSLAFLLEAGSEHPVARALRRSMRRPTGLVPDLREVREIQGQGIVGMVGERSVRVGNLMFMEAAGVATSAELSAHADALLGDGLSPLYVAAGGEVIGVAGVGDPLRPDAQSTVAELRRRGLEPWILSGDHPGIVARVADALAIPAEHAHGAMTPEQKRDFVQAFVGARTGRGRLAMVGDGVNDAAAMALADVGVAVEGGAGAALLAADVVVTRPGLSPLLDLFVGSRRVLGVVYRNLGFSLLYNLSGATLALLGLVGPLLAAILMPISSLTVILSSVLARSFPDRRRGRVTA